jgi:hypothetical protein
VASLLLGALLLPGCGDLERSGIPVSFSFRIDEPVSSDIRRRDFQRLDSLGVERVYLELIVEPHEDTLLPKINRYCLTQLSDLLPQIRKRGYELGLILNHSKFKPLFPSDSLPPAEQWFRSYRQEIGRMLKRCEGYPVQRLVLGTEFRPWEDRLHAWRQLTARLDTATQAQLIYTAEAPRIPTVALWPAVDAIGVSYIPSPRGNPKVSCRKWNRAIAETARKHDKPVFISHTNLIGQDKLIKFKNRLRFWHEDVRLSGVNVNTIYPVSVLTDTTKYFGMKTEQATKAYIGRYMRGQE